MSLVSLTFGLSTWFYVFELNPLIFFGIKMDIAL
jgi:hypothetical protein